MVSFPYLFDEEEQVRSSAVVLLGVREQILL
jgi:hypothetical protein